MTHDELMAELDRLLAETPPDAVDLGAELRALVQEHRNARTTERPLEAADWSR